MEELINYYSKEELNFQREIELIDVFINMNADKYTFTEPDHKKIFDFLVEKRLSQGSILLKEPPEFVLRILQLTRLMTREKTFVLELGKYDKIIEHLQLITHKSIEVLNGSTDEESHSAANIIVEIISIVKRFCSQDELFHQIFERGLFQHLIEILSTNKPYLISIFLDFLYFLCEFLKNNEIKEKFYSLIGQVFYLGRLIYVLENYEEKFKAQTVNLIARLVEKDSVNKNLQRIKGYAVLIKELKLTNNQIVKVSILNCIKTILNHHENIYEFKILGIVPLLHRFLSESKNFMETLLVLNIISQLIMDDDLSVKILEKGLRAVTLILLKCQPFSGETFHFEDIAEAKREDARIELEIHCFRLLRFLFSIEKNRKVFKLMFPPRLFALFIDVGNYVKAPSKYKPLVDEFNQLSKKDVENIASNLEEVTKEHSNLLNGANGLLTLGGYTLIEMIVLSSKEKSNNFILVKGKGAFGTVFLAKKGMMNKYAIKQIPFANMDLKDQPKKVEDSFEDHFKEVKIYKELNHPNIVKYFESFIDQESLCIVMEFVEGFNLSELIKIQNEKGQRFEEKHIWKIIINLCSVLHYLHVDKKIVHRDLNPANLMIDSNYNIKLADFGLAKKLTQSISLMNSFVGTLVYSCPEIVQNRPYSEKADVWSLGCIIFELINLKAPFSSSNPLVLAKKIVNGEKENTHDHPYSQKLYQFVEKCLTIEPERRPTAIELFQLINPEILAYLDDLKTRESQLNNEVVFLSKKMIARGSGTLKEEQVNPTVRLELKNLQKVTMDPLTKFLEIMQRLARIAARTDFDKNDIRKYCVDLFYEKVVLFNGTSPMSLKSELHKLVNLSKEEVHVGKVQTEDGEESGISLNVTYEQLNFYIEELDVRFRKGK